jgi:hypothetical protein
MTFLFLFLLLAFIVLLIFIGGHVLQRTLPPDHPLQKYLSDDSIQNAIEWTYKNIRFIAGALLAIIFTVLTLVYS